MVGMETAENNVGDHGEDLAELVLETGNKPQEEDRCTVIDAQDGLHNIYRAGHQCPSLRMAMISSSFNVEENPNKEMFIQSQVILGSYSDCLTPDMGRVTLDFAQNHNQEYTHLSSTF